MFDFVTTKRTLISLGLIVLIGTSLPGCGGDKKPPQNPFGPTTQRPPSRRPTVTVKKRRRPANANWKVVRVHFRTYLQKIENMEMDKIRDPFEPQMERWIDKPRNVVKVQPKRVETPKNTVPLSERPPLERYSVSRYQLKAIMSATEIPKALLVDPEGNGYIVWKNRTIGTEKGQIVAINQYEVIVKIPGRDPLRLSIAPKLDLFKTVQ